MNAPLVDPALAQSSLAERQVESMRRQAENFASADTAARERKLRKACEGFEAVFIQKMWESMRASLPKEGLMHSREEQFWQGMYDQELGKSMAAAGGIGLADMMVSQLSRNLRSATQVAVGRRTRTRLDIPPVPLLPPAASGTGAEQGGSEKAGAGKVAEKAPASMYEGEAARTAAVPEKTAPVAEAAPRSPVAGALEEFAAGGPDIARTAAPNTDGAGGTFTHVYRNGQRPDQSLDELAASLAAQATRENGGTVRVTTTRQVNGNNAPTDAARTRSMRRQAALRRSAAAERATEANQPAAMPQGLQPGQTGQTGQAGQIGQSAQSVQSGQPVQNGPSALTVSVDGVGSGQETDLDRNLQQI